MRTAFGRVNLPMLSFAAANARKRAREATGVTRRLPGQKPTRYFWASAMYFFKNATILGSGFCAICMIFWPSSRVT